jgi:hypothetical protein
MELMLVLIMFLVFLVVAGVMVHSLQTKKIPENFKSIYAPSKFYTAPISKYEKLGSLYSPFVTRPRDTYAHSYGGRCTNELYPKAQSKHGKGEIAGPCNPTTGGRYYGMRPILSPDTLQGMILSLFSRMAVPAPVDTQKLIHQNQFCESDSYSSVMKYVLGQINKTQREMSLFKDYAKADTWGGDHFAYLNEEIFMFTELNPAQYSEQEQAKRARRNNPRDAKFVLTFTLYMPLRSTSLDTTAVVLKHKNKYFITYINFTTKKATTDGPQGVHLDAQKGGEIVQPGGEHAQGPNWIYGNTLENKTFNLQGFHDPNEANNILIPGGVPEEYKEVLEKCDQGYLLDPANSDGPRFEGGAQSNSTVFAPPVYPEFPDTTPQWNARV